MFPASLLLYVSKIGTPIRSHTRRAMSAVTTSLSDCTTRRSGSVMSCSARYSASSTTAEGNATSPCAFTLCKNAACTSSGIPTSIPKLGPVTKDCPIGPPQSGISSPSG